MTKAQRQAALLELVRSQALRTQKDLGAALSRKGIQASQVTLSRDIRELGLVKTAEGYRQTAMESGVGARQDALARVVREFLTGVRLAQNVVVLKTKPGGAGPVALALDRAAWPEVAGTVAGDDTIFAATESAATARKTAGRIRRLL